MRYKVYDTVSQKYVTDDPGWVIKPDGALRYSKQGDEIEIPHCTVLFFPEDTDDYYIDEIGGEHDCGVGFAPDGVFCGECSNISCKVCGAWQRIQVHN